MAAPPTTPTAPKRRKKKPGWLWMLFWGKKRRGFPGLLVATVAVLVVVGVIVGISNVGQNLLRFFFLLPFLALVAVCVAAIVLTVLSALGIVKPRDRRRRRA